MKPLLITFALLASSVETFAAITVNIAATPGTPTTINKTVLSTKLNPAWRLLVPAKTLIDVTVSGDPAWTVALTGLLLTSCPNVGFCLKVSNPFDGITVSGGSGNLTVAANWNNGGPFDLATGNYNGVLTFTQTVGGATAAIIVNLKVLTASQTPSQPGEVKFTSNGPNTGCDKQSPDPVNAYTILSRCPVPNFAPQVLPALTQPAVGAVYHDTVFGNDIRRITDSAGTGQGCLSEYGGISGLSAQSTYDINSCGVYRVSDASQIRSPSSYPHNYNIINVYPSANDDQAFYVLFNNFIYKYNFVTNTETTVADMSVAPYYSHSNYEGGTNGVSTDDWIAFADNGDTSGSTNTIGFGTKTFVMASGLTYPVSSVLLVFTDEGNGANTMTGTVTGSSGATLTVNISATSGSGTSASWDVRRVNPRVYAVNLPDVIAHTLSASNAFFKDWDNSLSPGAPVLTGIDWQQVSDIDDVTGERYVYLGAAPVATVFTVNAPGTGTLTQKFIVPEYPEFNQNNGDQIIQAGEMALNSQNFSGHAIMCKDSDGQIYVAGTFQSVLPNIDYHAMYRVSAGLDFARVVEEGGGLTWLGVTSFDSQPGCSSRYHSVTFGFSASVNNFYSQASGSITSAGGVVTMTLVETPTWGTGSGNAIPMLSANSTSPWTCLNGIWPSVNNTAGNVITIAGTSCANQTAAASTFFLIGDARANTPTYFGTPVADNSQVQIWKRGKQAHAVIQHRDISWLNTNQFPLLQYYDGQPKTSQSLNGDYIVFNSNFGSLDYTCLYCNTSVYVATTGLHVRNAIKITQRNVNQTGALVTYTVPTGASCSFEVSDKYSFTSPLYDSFTDTGGPSRQTYIGRAVPLAVNTHYWVRFQCGLEMEAFDFTTLPATGALTKILSAQLGTQSVPGATKVIIQYRDAGASSFTSTASFPCAAGCIANWPGNVGTTNEWRVLYQDVSSNPLLLTGITSIAIPQ